jgi:Tol biopolymer transport system component
MTNASFRQLYVMDADGKNKRRLTDHWGDDYTPQWTNDGQWIVVQGTRGLEHHPDRGVSGNHKNCIVVVKIDGSMEQILPIPFGVYGIALRPKASSG